MPLRLRRQHWLYCHHLHHFPLHLQHGCYMVTPQCEQLLQAAPPQLRYTDHLGPKYIHHRPNLGNITPKHSMQGTTGARSSIGCSSESSVEGTCLLFLIHFLRIGDTMYQMKYPDHKGSKRDLQHRAAHPLPSSRSRELHWKRQESVETPRRQASQQPLGASERA